MYKKTLMICACALSTHSAMSAQNPSYSSKVQDAQIPNGRGDSRSRAPMRDLTGSQRDLPGMRRTELGGKTGSRADKMSALHDQKLQALHDQKLQTMDIETGPSKFVTEPREIQHTRRTWRSKDGRFSGVEEHWIHSERAMHGGAPARDQTSSSGFGASNAFGFRSYTVTRIRGKCERSSSNP